MTELGLGVGAEDLEAIGGPEPFGFLLLVALSFNARNEHSNVERERIAVVTVNEPTIYIIGTQTFSGVSLHLDY